MTAIRAAYDGPGLQVYEYRCTASVHDTPVEECHLRYCMALVRRGSFTVAARGRIAELVPGSVFLGYPGDTFTCRHDHHCGGDECLSFDFTADWIEEIGGGRHLWQSVSVPPLAQLGVVGALAEAAVRGRSGVSVEEAGYALAARLSGLFPGARSAVRLSAQDRRRATETARWIEAHAAQAISLTDAAAVAGLSPFHFLRVFRAVNGATPHQYLMACRLRHAAAELLATELSITEIALDCGFSDLSNFVRTFGRAAAMTPSRFRAIGSVDRNILQAESSSGR